jgi:SAM-dependent methyltransferase
MSKAEAIRDWDKVAGGWDAEYDWYARNIYPLSQWFCRTAVRPGATIVDLASGTGVPALPMAEALHGTGKVIATDYAPEMVAVLRRRAAPFANVEVRELDAEALDLPDASVDAITSSCGLMFFADADRAVQEMRRVLQPRGRLALAVWSTPDEVPFLSVGIQVFMHFLPPRPHDPSAPSPFRFCQPGQLEAVVARNGFPDVVVDTLPMTFVLGTVQEYWNILLGFASGLADKVAVLSDTDRARAYHALRAACEPHLVDGRLHLTATARVLTLRGQDLGRKAV